MAVLGGLRLHLLRCVHLFLNGVLYRFALFLGGSSYFLRGVRRCLGFCCVLFEVLDGCLAIYCAWRLLCLFCCGMLDGVLARVCQFL